MGSGSKYVREWSAGTLAQGIRPEAECVQGGPLPTIAGHTPKVVIASATEGCDGDGGRHTKGIVFYDHEPVAWCCLADDEIADFTAWAAKALPTAPIIHVPQASPVLNCPPFIAAPHAAAVRERVRDALREAARDWLAPPRAA
jgi:hypothetical protein